MDTRGGASSLQRVLLAAYGRALRWNLLSIPLVRAAYDRAYFAYKLRYEAGVIEHLRAVVPAGSVVVDVGANIGFFTASFARWVGPQGKVIALEPEARNFEHLRYTLRRFGIEEVVECIQAVAVDQPGDYELEVQADHPGGHYLSTSGSGVPTPGVTVDQVVGDSGNPQVSLIKIDVQGAEALVLAGARKTIESSLPAIFVELDAEGLAQFQTSPVDVAESLWSRGYSSYFLGGSVPRFLETAADITSLLGASGKAYEDVLFTRERLP